MGTFRQKLEKFLALGNFVLERFDGNGLHDGAPPLRFFRRLFVELDAFGPQDIRRRLGTSFGNRNSVLGERATRFHDSPAKLG